MTKSNTPKLNPDDEKVKKEAKETVDHAEALYEQVKGRANEMYEEGKKSVSHAHDSIKECTDGVIKHVREKPIASLLIAGGIGFILSSLLRK
jgi:ElaB/YqjD/DUF883 family membrane-anchored ribosome-binding protein